MSSQSFGAITKPKQRKEKPNKKQREAFRLGKEDEAKSKPKSIEAVSAELLSFKTVREGMIILGCVKAITPISIEVALPGRMSGFVRVPMISQTYFTLTQNYVEKDDVDSKSDNVDEYKPLVDLFKIGQVVCAKVMKINTTKTNKIQIELSMQPKDIHLDFQHQHVSKNMLMSVAIAERQEHGFVLETGVNNLRGFLPESQNDLIVGSVYFCRVQSVTNSSSASTATFELADTQNSRLVQFTDLNVNHILPGVLVKFTVTKLLKDGLQGTIFNGNLVAYINEHQLGFSDKQVPRVTKDYDVGAVLRARVLYVMPLTKIVYLSLNLQNQFKVFADGSNKQKIFPNGTIVPDSVVSHIGTGGIVLNIGSAKGVVSMRSLKGDIKSNFDMETLLSKYEANSKHKVRVLHYDPIDLLHICSVDPKIINEKYFSCNDVKTGDFVTAKIQQLLKDGRYAVTVGKIKGFINPIYLSSSTSKTNLKPNSKLKCRVLCKNQSKDEIFLTNLKEYMDAQAPILTANNNLSLDKVFVGVVKQCLSDGWMIEFFDYITGMVYRNQLQANELSNAERFCTGQVIKVSISHVRHDNGKKKLITLQLGNYSTNIGNMLKGKISEIQSTGFEVAFPQANLNGFIPMMYLSDFPSLVHALHRVYKSNDNVEAIGVEQNCYSIRDVTDILGGPTVVKKFSEIQVGEIIPASIKNVNNELIEVHCLIKDYRSTVTIHLNMFLENVDKAGDVTILPDQKLYVRILARNTVLKTLTCSARLDDVWPGNFKHTVQMVRRYFGDIQRIENRISPKHSIKSYRIGQIVYGTLTKSDRMDSNNIPLRLFTVDNGVKLYVTKQNDATQKQNEKHKILIVWIDYSNEVLYGTMLPKYLKRAEIEQEEEKAANQLLTHCGFKANVLLVLEDIIITYPTKWTNRFVYIPTRVHYNDFQPLVAKGVSEGSQVNISLIDAEGDQFIGMFHNLFELYSRKIDQTIEFVKNETENTSYEDKQPKKSKKLAKFCEKDDQDIGDISTEIVEQPEKIGECNAKDKSKRCGENECKRKLIEVVNDESTSKKRRKSTGSVQNSSENKIHLISTAKKSPRSEKKAKKVINNRLSMKLSQMDGAMDLIDNSSDEEEAENFPGVSNFWSSDLNILNEDASKQIDEESSDEEDNFVSKKQKLNSKDRFEAARCEEARIHEIEKSLADDSILPTTIDQFDRLVIAEPNNSRVWIKYIVFHVQAAEIDRARAIAQKALKTIHVNEQQERLNVWVALLNMELRFGSKDAFDDVLKEAVLVNDPFKVYSVCLKIFASCKCTQELCDMVLLITKKFRQNSECWLNAAQAFFDVNLNDKAKSLLNRALNSIPERERKPNSLKTNFLIFLDFF